MPQTTNESVLRVIQALTIKSQFHYVLTIDNIKELESLGYRVTIIDSLFPWLKDCKIEKAEIDS